MSKMTPLSLLVGLTFLALALVKVVLLLTLDPIINPKDAAGYVRLADDMLAGTGWLHDARLDEGYRAGWGFRPLGYPALIGLAKWIGDEGFGRIVVAMQSMLTLVTCYVLYATARSLGSSSLLSLLVSVCYFFSLIIAQDLELMSDSVFSNLTIIVTLLIIVFAMEARPPILARVGALGLLAAAAMLIRPSGLYHTLLIAVGVGIWCLGSSRPFAVRLGLIAVFLLPTLLVWEGYNRWNEYRTGERFFTTSHFVLLQPVVAAQERGAPVLDEHPLLAEAFAATEGTPCPDPHPNECAYARAEAMDDYLFREHGIRAPELARLVSGAYAASWRTAPDAQLVYILLELFRGARPHNLLNFTYGPRQLAEYHTGEPAPGLIERLRTLTSDMSLSNLVLLAVEVVHRGFSLALTACFFVGVPALVACVAVRNRHLATKHLMLAWLWGVSVASLVMYSLVTAQQRYLISVIAFATLGGVTALGCLARRQFRAPVSSR